jgi:hypothetical protein
MIKQPTKIATRKITTDINEMSDVLSIDRFQSENVFDIFTSFKPWNYLPNPFSIGYSRKAVSRRIYNNVVTYNFG